MTVERFREITEKLGFNYGTTFSVIKEIWQRDNEGLCLIDISGLPKIQTEAKDYVVHPCVIDACLQSCFVPIGNFVTGDTSFVPVGFKSIILNDVPSTSQLYCHVTADMTTFGRFHVTLMSPSGRVLLTINDFHATELTNTERRFAFADLVYEVQWMENELQGQREIKPNLTCVVLKDSSEFSNAMVRELQEAKVHIFTVNPPDDGCFDTEAEEAIKETLSRIPPSNLSHLTVINMWPVETSILPGNFNVIDQAQRLAIGSSAFLLKLLLEKQWLDSRLFLVTERTQLLNACEKSPHSSAIPWSSSVWGFRRAARLEEFDVRMIAVDLSSKNYLHEVGSLIDEVLGDSAEEEVAFRDGKRFINRVVRSKVSPEQATTKEIESKKWASLYLSRVPSSRTLCLREKSLSKPSKSELTMDLLYCWTPSESLNDLSQPKGCVFLVGKVTNLLEMSESSQLHIGDEVCGVIASGRISPSLSIQVNNVFPKPTSLTTEQAAYIPACLAIASHALQRVVLGYENQKLLIHEANRGPGPAAVALAKALGHRVFCTISDTCQTSTKTSLLEMGAESVVRQSFAGRNDDSSHSFDAILFFYPPSPNALHKSDQSLKEGGRVVILSSEFPGDVVFTATAKVRYEREDMAGILRSPQAYEKLSLASLEFLESKRGIEKLLEIEVVSMDLATAVRAENASLDNPSSPNNQMKESSSISFLIHSSPSSEKDSDLYKIPVLPCGLDECGLKQNRTYLVAGGIRGYGFEVACWMVENGAKYIGLLGRSKPSDAKYQEVREIERKTGANIYMFQVIPMSKKTH